MFSYYRDFEYVLEMYFIQVKTDYVVHTRCTVYSVCVIATLKHIIANKQRQKLMKEDCALKNSLSIKHFDG